MFAEQSVGNIDDDLLFAGVHDVKKILILFIKGFH